MSRVFPRNCKIDGKWLKYAKNLIKKETNSRVFLNLRESSQIMAVLRADRRSKNRLVVHRVSHVIGRNMNSVFIDVTKSILWSVNGASVHHFSARFIKRKSLSPRSGVNIFFPARMQEPSLQGCIHGVSQRQMESSCLANYVGRQ